MCKFNKALNIIERSEPTGTTEEQNHNMAVAIHLGKAKTMDYHFKNFDHMKWRFYPAWTRLRCIEKFTFKKNTSLSLRLATQDLATQPALAIQPSTEPRYRESQGVEVLSDAGDDDNDDDNNLETDDAFGGVSDMIGAPPMRQPSLPTQRTQSTTQSTQTSQPNDGNDDAVSALSDVLSKGTTRRGRNLSKKHKMEEDDRKKKRKMMSDLVSTVKNLADEGNKDRQLFALFGATLGTNDPVLKNRLMTKLLSVAGLTETGSQLTDGNNSEYNSE